MNNYKINFSLFIALLFIFWFWGGSLIELMILNSTKKITICELSDVHILAEGGPSVHYNYEIKSKKYSNSFWIRSEEYSKYKKMFEKKYLLEYSSTFPSISKIRLDYPVDTLGKGNLIPKDGWNNLEEAKIFFGFPSD